MIYFNAQSHQSNYRSYFSRWRLWLRLWRRSRRLRLRHDRGTWQESSSRRVVAKRRCQLRGGNRPHIK